nr:hypothetical protein [Tanacetum cinerariifolium]
HSSFFLKEAAIVRDFKSLAKEVDEYLVKHKYLEYEIERLLRAVISQDIMSIVQSNSVVDTSNLQTELECFENRPPMLNKENYVPWSSRLLRYAKSRPNGKLIHNSIINGSYVRRMIPEPGDPNREVHVNETFHVLTYDELTEKEHKQIEADDQAIQTIVLGLPEDIYVAVDSCETA